MKRKCIHCGHPVPRGAKYFCSSLCRQSHNTGKSVDELIRDASRISDGELRFHDSVVASVYGREGDDFFDRQN